MYQSRRPKTKKDKFIETKNHKYTKVRKKKAIRN